MNSKLLFGDCAELRSEKVDPKSSQESYYIGLEHIEQQSLCLVGHGFGSDVDSQKQRFYKGDILFGKLRPYFRKVVVAPFDGICSTDIWVVKPKAGIDRNFLFYWMASEEFIASSMHASEGGRMPRAKWDWVSKFELKNFTPKEQSAIGTTLGALDQKIAANNSLSKTLEDISQTIFKSWFIDFDPVKSKMADEKPEGMDDATAALFPDSMEESELGLIPKGWKVEKFGEVNDLLMGQSPPGDTYNSEGEGLPFYQGRTDFGFRFPKRRIFCTQENRVALPGQTLVSVRAPVGDINQAIEKCIIGRGVASVLHNSNSDAYTFALLKSLYPSLAFFNGEGTVFGAINRSDFNNMPVVEPPSLLVERFEIICGPMNEKIRNLFLATETLTQLRDSLLPRLISGELQIPEEMLAS
jgi:type I restriction enzyme, S subunit